MDLNEAIFLLLNRPGHPVLDAIMISLGIAGYVYVAALWALPLWATGRRRLAADFLALILLDFVLSAGLKAIFANPRPTIGTLLPPFDRDGYSFPSAHTTRVFAMALLLSMHVKDRRWHVPFFAYAVLTGISRIYVGVHWPSDVLAGAILGLAYAYGFDRVTRIPAYGKARDRVVEWAAWLLRKLHLSRSPPDIR